MMKKSGRKNNSVPPPAQTLKPRKFDRFEESKDYTEVSESKHNLDVNHETVTEFEHF